MATAPTHHATWDTDLLKVVPPLRSDRVRIRLAALARAERLDRSHPLSRDGIETCARTILAELGLAQAYCGWTMVAVATAFWRPQVETIPPSRRLLLLPHCLRDSQTCPAQYNEVGLLCQDCGACRLSDLRAAAQRQGYHVLIAEGSPAVIEIILRGTADAILGAACLNSLEKVFGKILVAGIPCMAVPLLASTCRDTSIDVDWVCEMIETPYRPGGAAMPTYLPLLRAAARLFDEEELERLLPRATGGGWRGTGQREKGSGGEEEKGRQGEGEKRTAGEGVADTSNRPLLPFSPSPLLPHQPPPATDPLTATETLADDFLRRGGKHLRPFVTLAAYAAMTDHHGNGSGKGTRDWGLGAREEKHRVPPAPSPQPPAPSLQPELPDAVKRIALAIEVFHKASLVHDDIEDDDPFRYGLPALHRQHGVPMAINVGDYLIGLGYRLVAGVRDCFPGDVVADVLARFADAHTRLCEGQGAELAWRGAADKRLTPLEALKIYALKTAPAFEAALYAGMRLADGGKRERKGEEEKGRRGEGETGRRGQERNESENGAPRAGSSEQVVLPFSPSPLLPFSPFPLLAKFARHLGVAYQILNDLEDWRQEPNKRATGADVLAGQPTVLWALAMESLPPDDRRRLQNLIADRAGAASEATLEEVRRLYDRAGVFGNASSLIAKHRERAHEVAESFPHAGLSQLFHYLADTILDG